jgi:hypothetical protein
MSNETNSNDSASYLNKLNPEAFSRLYPGGWDLSEHCTPSEALKAAASRAEDAQDSTASVPGPANP